MKLKQMLFLLGAIALMIEGQQMATNDTASTPMEETLQESKVGLIKVSILYPNGEGATFDMDYYSTKHMPMCAELFGDSLRYMDIDEGMAGRTPDEPVPYLAVGSFYFDQLSAYQNSFGPQC